MGNPTGLYSDTSELKRKEWIMEGLLQSKSKSIFDGLTGTSASAAIYQKNMAGYKHGNRVTFDFDGNYATSGFLGKEQAYGKADNKKKFTSGVTLDRVRYTVNNGDKFDNKSIGASMLFEHSNSRDLLADNFIRSKDQNFINAFQGSLNNIGASHIISPGGVHTAEAANLTSGDDKWSYDFLQELDEILSTGDGFAKGGKRRPLDPINGTYLVYIDSSAHLQLLKDPDMREVWSNADVRGKDNVLLKNVIAKFGNLILIKMPNFHGQLRTARISGDITEIAGAKKISANGNWSGSDGFNADVIANATMYARSFVVGANAIQYGMGEAPDYRVQESIDYGINSESALITYMGIQKTQLLAEDDDYIEAKVGGLDYGVIAIDSYYKN